MSVQIIQGDCLAALRELPAESVHCVVTSPPYWGLRDYGWGRKWYGGDEQCNHIRPPLDKAKAFASSGLNLAKDPELAQSTVASQHSRAYSGKCGKCGATSTDRCIGLEPKFSHYLVRMVDVFREVRRVLRADGVLWCQMGDSFEDKQLLGQPWRLAFALEDDGWCLRSEVIWSKPNPMPESVTDRPTKAHEQVFLLTKSPWLGPSRGQFGHIRDEDARWLALFVDTEGSIGIKRVKLTNGNADSYAPQVSIGNTHRGILERVVEITGHGNILEREGKNAPMFYWQVASKVARDFLYRIYPHLIIKQRQASIGIYLDSLTYRRGGQKPERKCRTHAEDAVLRSLWERGKECNHFGTPDLSDVPAPKYGKWGSARYFYDADAVREGVNGTAHSRGAGVHPKSAPAGSGTKANESFSAAVRGLVSSRNLRTVWNIATQPYAAAHFATFPERLPDICIRAGTSEKGCCAECGAPWERVVEVSKEYASRLAVRRRNMEPPNIGPALLSAIEAEGITSKQVAEWFPSRSGGVTGCVSNWTSGKNVPTSEQWDTLRARLPLDDEFDAALNEWWDIEKRWSRIQEGRWGESPEQLVSPSAAPSFEKQTSTTGWRPTCTHDAPTVPCVVLDPFAGSGTVGVVAHRNGCHSILIEGNPEYVELIKRRTAECAQRGLFSKA